MSAKTDRIETRVSADEKRQIDRAAALEGRTVSAFIVSAAVERANEVLAARDATIVPADYFDRLLAAMDVPDAAPSLRRASRTAGRSNRIAR